MSLVIEQDIPESPTLSKEAKVEAILKEMTTLIDGDIDYESIGREALALIIASVKGKIDLKTQDRQDLRAIFNQLTPSAPKRVEIEASIRPEEYIAEAMESSVDSFSRLQAKAAEYEVIAMEKLEALTLYTESKNKDAGSIKSEGVISSAEGDSRQS